jgi:uncharacterized protein
MRIGVLSDSHGNIPMVVRALEVLRERDVQTVIHCGDIDDAATVSYFRGFDAHFVFGNCDHDRAGISDAIEAEGLTLHEPFGYLELDGKKLAFIHGDDHHRMLDLERSDAFDYLFYGHSHQAAEHRTGRTRVINPGALQRARPKTIAVFDLAGGDVQSMVVG